MKMRMRVLHGSYANDGGITKMKETRHVIVKKNIPTETEAKQYISSIAKRFSLQPSAPRNFEMTYSGARLGTCKIHRVVHSPMSFDVDKGCELFFTVPEAGRISFFGSSGETAASARRQALIIPAEAEGRCEMAGVWRAMSLAAPAKDILVHKERLLGENEKTELSVNSVASYDLGGPAAGALARNLASVFRELESMVMPVLSEIACASFDEMLLGLLVAALIPSSLNELPRRGREASRNVVRKAREHLREHAAEPIRLGDLASELGVGLRSLQMAFRKDVGCSPRDYLMQCRLDLARARLQTGTEGIKISDVAFESGFTDLGLFARKYRHSFGELPSETLKRR